MIRTVQKDGKRYVSNSLPLMKCLFCKKISTTVSWKPGTVARTADQSGCSRQKTAFSLQKNMEAGEEVVNEDPPRTTPLLYETIKEPELYNCEKKLCIELNE